MTRNSDERVKQVAIGAGILMAVTTVVTGMLLGWTRLPGLFGEWVGSIIGIMTTPFFMEASFLVLGLVIVIGVNTWHRHKEGDDFVYLEHITEPELQRNLPDQAKPAIFREKTLDIKESSPLELAERAFQIGDFKTASEWIGAICKSEIDLPEVLELKLKLATAAGHPDLAKSLEIKNRNTTP